MLKTPHVFRAPRHPQDTQVLLECGSAGGGERVPVQACGLVRELVCKRLLRSGAAAAEIGPHPSLVCSGLAWPTGPLTPELAPLPVARVPQKHGQVPSGSLGDPLGPAHRLHRYLPPAVAQSAKRVGARPKLSC